MSKRLLVMLFLFPLLLLAALLALSSLGKGRFLRDSGPTRLEYSGHERVGGTNFVLFTFTNAEECALGLEAEVRVRSASNQEVWKATPVKPVEMVVVPRGRAFTFRVPVPEGDRDWFVALKMLSRPTLGEKVTQVPAALLSKGRGFGYPPLQGAVGSPVMRGAEPAPSQSQRGASASSAP